MSSAVIKEIIGTIEELCIFPEYEFIVPITEVINPIAGSKALPAQTFETSPAFNYRSWAEPHSYSGSLIMFRFVIISPKHLDLPPKLMSEAMVPLAAYSMMVAPLESFTLKTLREITV
jgi:hypothetical protein